jgi:PKHD-type hydroxylase
MKQLQYTNAQHGVVIDSYLPDELVTIITKYLNTLPLHSGTTVTPSKLRLSHVGFTEQLDWVSALLWYYVTQANQYNFQYDIETLDGGKTQYTVYEKGMYYDWHDDDNIINSAKIEHPKLLSHVVPIQEYVRKLSFSLQLSSPDEYEGGELQFLSNRKLITASKERGHLVVFDSRLSHRVRKVKSGIRKSLVGWVLGPRWK